ncbi:MAG: hypothetical protein IJ782_05735 [Prevotella sp.]|nr:hypothetical protein [Prevotella sp.]
MKRCISIIIIMMMVVMVAMADAVGTWKIYPSYSTITNVEPTGNKVFVLADGNLYSYNVNTTEIKEYNITTEPKLNGRNITHIAWVKQTSKLIIVYDDYLIDILSNKDVVTSVVGLHNASSQKDRTVNSIVVSGQYVFIATGLGVLKIDTKEEYIVKTYKVDEEVPDMPATSGVTTKDGPDGTVYHDQTNKCWWGGNADGKLTKYVESEAGMTATSSGVAPDAPFTSACWRLYKHDGKLFVTAGAYAIGLPSAEMEKPGLVQYYDGSSWTKLEDPGRMTGYDYIAANCMVFDTKDKNHFWVGAGSGLYEYRNYKPVKAFNSTNSALPKMYNSVESLSNVTTLLYDANNNLWTTNGWSDVFLTRFDGNGESVSFPHSQHTFVNRHAVDIQGTFISPTNGYMFFVNSFYKVPVLYYYNYKTDGLSSIMSFVNEDGGDIAPNYLYDLAEDSEGNLWVASTSGPFYWSRSDMASGTATFVQHKVNRNDGSGLADYLLSGVPTRCMYIDKADRKWFGTAEDGIYLISGDNNTQLQHFTKENSCLPSNTIYDVFVDEETGIVWIATNAGLCSYQSDVTETYGEMNDDNVYAYPNPVEPDYTGDITIMGLTDGAQVTITTPSGYVVNRGTCVGGSYTWNGRDREGLRVASGVYNVLVATAGGESGCVTKIAVIR